MLHGSQCGPTWWGTSYEHLSVHSIALSPLLKRILDCPLNFNPLPPPPPPDGRESRWRKLEDGEIPENCIGCLLREFCSGPALGCERIMWERKSVTVDYERGPFDILWETQIRGWSCFSKYFHLLHGCTPRLWGWFQMCKYQVNRNIVLGAAVLPRGLSAPLVH